MQKKRLQNKIAESRCSLPATLAGTIAVWAYAGLKDASLWPTTAIMLIASLVVMELNNANALIRIYSRMVSCAFVAFVTMTIFLYVFGHTSIVTLCAALAYLLLFKCYQDNRSPGWVFYAFACIGIASTVWVQMLFFVPFLWIIMSTKLQCMGLRTFVASILGLIMPYWFFIAYFVLTNQPERFIAHFGELVTFGPLFNFPSSFTFPQWGAVAFILLCALIGGCHFFVTRFNDKIRIRMLYDTFITIDVLALIFIIFQPQHIAPLSGLIALNSAPLIAHFLALSHGRISNCTTIVLFILSIILIIANLWEVLQRF